MRRIRFLLTVAILAIGFFVATSPVFAAAGGNGKGNNGNGNGSGGPGAPALPEAPIALLLPLVGFAVVVLAFSVIHRRQRALAVAE